MKNVKQWPRAAFGLNGPVPITYVHKMDDERGRFVFRRPDLPQDYLQIEIAVGQPAHMLDAIFHEMTHLALHQYHGPLGFRDGVVEYARTSRKRAGDIEEWVADALGAYLRLAVKDGFVAFGPAAMKGPLLIKEGSEEAA